MKYLLVIFTLISCDIISQELTITCPSDLSLDCGENTSEFGVAETEGSCAGIIISYTDTSVEVSCPTVSRIERLWSATDDCGNYTECTQTISFEDSEAPTIQAYQIIDWPCDDLNTIRDSLTINSVFDNCSTYDILQTSQFISGGCSGMLSKTITATDFCGNSSEFLQIIDLYDYESPVIECPSDTVFLCGETFDLTDPIISDNCTQAYLSIETDTIGDSCPIYIYRTFTVADDCNNIAQCPTQLIEILPDYGCMDELACNFNPLAETEDGTCGYVGNPCIAFDDNIVNESFTSDCDCLGELSGCTDPAACNYVPEAIVDNEGCQFIGNTCEMNNDSILGITNSNCNCQYTEEVVSLTFIDNNFNGVFDIDEQVIPGQMIQVENESITSFTNDEGFSFLYLLEGSIFDPEEHTLQATFSQEWEFNTTENIQEIELNSEYVDTLFFGVANSTDYNPTPTGELDFFSSEGRILCYDESTLNIKLRNTSPYILNGVIEVEIDNQLELSSTQPAYDSIVGQSVFWSFDNLESWDFELSHLIINTPDESLIGSFVTNTVSVYGWHDEELLLIGEEERTEQINCTSGVNDILGIPEGVGENHLVLEETEMEYFIRFQNTGNTAAEQIKVVTYLNPGFDNSTFDLKTSSHSVNTTIFPSGKVEFLFEDINLPDSITNEPESHGLVSFTIDFDPTITLGEEVNQTAEIYFDENSAIITNTTLHTIHECGGESEFESSDNSFCIGEEVVLNSTYPNPEILNFSWITLGEQIGTDSILSTTFDGPQTSQVVILLGQNPLCTEQGSQVFDVFYNPVVLINQEGSILSVSDGESYQWLLNGEIIEEATSQTLEAVEDGNYSVELTNENNCTSTSPEVIVVNITEVDKTSFILYLSLIHI